MILHSYTGKSVNVLDYRPEDVCFKDIFERLTRECRWGGGCREFYSVGEHSLWVGKICKMLGGREIDGLLHDCHEAYLKDIPTPIKPYLGIWYGVACDHIDFTLYEALGIVPPEDKEIIKQADCIVAWLEARLLMGPNHPILIEEKEPEQRFQDVFRLLRVRPEDIYASLYYKTKKAAEALGSCYVW